MHEIDTKKVPLHRATICGAEACEIIDAKRRRRCYPLAGWETAPGLVRTAYDGTGMLVVTRVTTGALSGALIYTVDNLIPLAVGVRSRVLTRTVTGGEAGNVWTSKSWNKYEITKPSPVSMSKEEYPSSI